MTETWDTIYEKKIIDPFGNDNSRKTSILKVL